jgi:cytochrome b561
MYNYNYNQRFNTTFEGNMTTLPNKYNLTMRILHWLVAFMLITLLVVGFIMANMPNSAQKWEIYTMHKSFGLVFLGLALLRLIVRLSSTIPADPEGIPSYQYLFAKVIRALMYLAMIFMPISGFVMSVSGGHTVKLFGLIDVFNPFPYAVPQVSAFAHGVHGVLALVLVTLIVLHLSGSTKHYLVEKINLIKRIW